MHPLLMRSFIKNLISVYMDDLEFIVVKLDIQEVCTLISNILVLQTQTYVITRAYRFLNKYKWRPSLEDKSKSWLWIPNQLVTRGKWVSSQICVLYDRENLFSAEFMFLINIMIRICSHFSLQLLLFLKLLPLMIM